MAQRYTIPVGRTSSGSNSTQVQYLLGFGIRRRILSSICSRFLINKFMFVLQNVQQPDSNAPTISGSESNLPKVVRSNSRGAMKVIDLQQDSEVTSYCGRIRSDVEGHHPFSFSGSGFCGWNRTQRSENRAKSRT